MARIVDLVLVLFLAISGHFSSARALAIRNSPAMEENCVLSFVVPRDKVKSSCDVEAKVQRRINAVETRADVYRQQVTKLSLQVEKQMVASANRLDRVEAEVTAMSDVSGSGRDSGNSLGQLSKRLGVLERGMNQLYAKMSGSHESTARDSGKDGGESGFESSGRLFTDSTKEGKHFSFGLEDQIISAEIESLVKSMVNAEVNRLTGDFTTFMREYKQVLSLFLPSEKAEVVDSDIGVASDTKSPGSNDKHIPDSGEDAVAKQGTKQTGNNTDISDMVQENHSKVEKADEMDIPGLAEYIQNLTSVAYPNSSESSDTLGEYLGALNISDVYLISDGLPGTNDTFSGDNTDLNTTDIQAAEDGDDFNIGTSRIGQSGGETTPAAETKNSIQNSTEDKVKPKKISETATPGWMRDEVDRQSVLEERFKTEIRAMLVRPLANIVSLVEKQAASLRDEIQLQGKRTQESFREIHDRVDRLDSNAKSVVLRVDSLSTGFQESHGRLDRMRKLEGAVSELKKNLSSSMAFLNDDADAESYRGDGKKEAEPVKGLSHLVKLYNTNLEHHANETTRIINNIKSEVDEKIDEIRKKIPDNEQQFKSRTEQAMRHVNTTLDVLNRRIEEMEDQIVEQKTDLGLHISGSERKRKSSEREFKDLRKSLGSIRGKHRELSERIRGLDNTQSRLGAALSETDSKIDDLQLDLQLMVSDEWVPYRFAYDASRTACFGEQYVRRLDYKRVRYVGVMLCDSHRYKIFLGASLDDTFLNIGDMSGFGEDHCEFVGATKTAKVTVSQLNARFDSVTGYSRKNYGDEVVKSKINLLKPSPQWYECGVSIP